MKNTTFKLFYLLTIFCSFKGYSELPRYEFDLETGYRKDSLNWNIGGPNRKPNILSELNWKDLTASEITSCFKIFQNNGYIRLSGNYAHFFSGSVQDSDYFGDNRKGEYSRSKAKSSGSHAYGISTATGFQFPLCSNQLIFYPLIGYAWNAQHFKIKDGFQIIDLEDNFYGSLYRLHSSYKSRFQGPFIGIDLNYRVNPLFTILATFEYHFLKYTGTGHWNFRKDFYKDFQHTANGHGVFGSLGAFYQINSRLSLGITFKGKCFKAKQGNVKFYALIKDKKLIINQPFNNVTWKSFNTLFSMRYVF